MRNQRLVQDPAPTKGQAGKTQTTHDLLARPLAILSGEIKPNSSIETSKAPSQYSACRSAEGFAFTHIVGESEGTMEPLRVEGV